MSKPGHQSDEELQRLLDEGRRRPIIRRWPSSRCSLTPTVIRLAAIRRFCCNLPAVVEGGAGADPTRRP